MQPSVEVVGEIARKVQITIPAEQITKQVEQRLSQIAKTAKIDGFRPGKAPLTFIRKKYAQSAREDVLGKLIHESFYAAIGDLAIAGGPDIDVKTGFAEGEVVYEATFEVYPEIKPVALSGETIEVIASQVTETDIDNMLAKLRKQRVTFEQVERAAIEGDKLTVDLLGTLAGEETAKIDNKDVELVLGEGRMIPGFEAGLIGAKPGEQVTLNIEFPADYHRTEFAGKPVQFVVTVKTVAAANLPELTEEFAKMFEVDSIAALRDTVRKNMERQLQKALQTKVKEQIMDKLLALHPIEIPKYLVKQESKHLAEEAQKRLRQNFPNQQNFNMPLHLFEKQAIRRLQLGFIVRELIKINKLEVDPVRVQTLIEQAADIYHNPEEIIKWYNNDKTRLKEFEALALEEQLMDILLAQAQRIEKTLCYDEVEKLLGEQK